jgi:plastocyanin
MRSLHLAVALGIGSLGLLCLAPGEAEARGQRHRFDRGRYYAPVVTVRGNAPCPPVYQPFSYRPAPQFSFYPAPVYRRATPFDRSVQPAPPSAPSAPGSAPAQPTTTASVGMYDNYFQPNTLIVLPGTTVRWTHSGQHKHTVTSAMGQWDSGELGSGAVYSVTFTQPGTYPYYCRIHSREMRGTIVVK